jgi:EF hand domain-containing protein
MKWCRIVVALYLLSLTVGTYADTQNVRKGKSQLEFRSAAARTNGGASGGSSARRAPDASEKEAMFRYLDIDGDGFVSKAEAAGNEAATLGFDRADRDRDGKLSFAEYDSIGKPRPPKRKVARDKGAASAGSTKKPN